MAVRTWAGRDTEADTGPEHFQVTHEGLVLALGEHNGYDDSDFYAVVWDDEQGRPREVTYATTRGWTYHNSAAVDATPEVTAKYQAWQARLRDDREAMRAAAEAAAIRKGRPVRIVRGRKVPVGTEGRVIWTGTGHRGRERIGLRTAAGDVHWTAAANAEVIDGPDPARAASCGSGACGACPSCRRRLDRYS